MSLTNTYFENAAVQQRAADDADLVNVRERCQRASDAWTALAVRHERMEAARERTAAQKNAPDPDA